MSETNDSTENVKYKTYIDERATLASAKKDSCQYFDKAILTLAAGALGLSLTFITKVVPNPTEPTLILLTWSWIFFCASMLSTLVSLLTSQHACERQIEILKKEFYDNESGLTNKTGIITAVLNWFSIILFVAGICFMVAFSVLNLKEIGGKNMSKDKVERGYAPPKTPSPPPPKPSSPGDAGYKPPQTPVPPPPKK